MAELMGLDGARLKALLRLRARLTLRQFSRERGRIVIALLVVVFVAPYVLGAAVMTTIGYLRLDAPLPGELLGGVLVALWLLWLLFPIIFASLNEGLDLTRLLVYPLSRRELVAGVLLGSLFDYPTYLALPLFVAVLVGWNQALLVALAGVLLSYAHMVLTSQIVVAVLGGVLQSRRFRDATIVVSALLGSSCYFLQSGFNSALEKLTDNLREAQMPDVHLLKTLQWLPTGAVARAIERASAGEWLAALAWLLYSAAWLLILAGVWWQLVLRLTTGGGFLLSLAPRAQGAPKRAQAPKKRAGAGRDLLAWLPDDVAQLARKEFKSISRTPRRRVLILQMTLSPFVLLAAGVLRGGISLTIPSWVGLALPFYAMYLCWAGTQDVLAWEGRGLSLLLLTPVPRQRIFIAKGLALLAAIGVPFAVISSLLVVLTRDWQSVAAALTGLNVGLAAISVTSVFSVLFPTPINTEGKSARRTTTRGSCSAALANVFLAPSVISLVSLPAGAPLALAVLLDNPWLAVVGLLAGAAYAAFVFWYGTRLAGRLLLRREAEVWEALQVPGDAGG